MYSYETLRPLLFRLDAETSHDLTRGALATAQTIPWILNALRQRYRVDDPRLAQRVLGCTFRNPIGLAAGFDKNAQVVPAMEALGFGFVEVGSVTPLAQAGNPKPRLFRHIDAKSIQNAMGFNNAGAVAVARRLAKLPPRAVPLGVNLGKNKATPTERALDDYRALISQLHLQADYLVVNVSSPNTPGLRDLQSEAFVGELFQLAKQLTQKPVLLKIAPDISTETAVSLCSVAVDHGAAGIIATNTTTDYSLVPGAQAIGGISGQALRDKSFAMLRALAAALYGKAVLISVGGVDSAEEAYRRLAAGASLVQVYTALIYEGPALVARINRGLLQHLQRDGVRNIHEVIGSRRPVTM
jgi:dihydroorotate dehydrogenase